MEKIPVAANAEPENPDEYCGNCDCFLAMPNQEANAGPRTLGICRRFPPQVIGGLVPRPPDPAQKILKPNEPQSLQVDFVTNAFYPSVMAGAWCAEWSGEEAETRH